MGQQFEKTKPDEEKKGGGVSLWDLLSALSGLSAFGGVLGVLKNSHLSADRYFFALVLGLVISVACVLIIRIVGGWLLNYLSQADVEQPRVFCWADFAGKGVYLFACMWVIVSSILTSVLTKSFVDWHG